jgi:uncharacterized protein DUF5681
MSEHSSDYQVGYGKPPRHTRFQKGRSGNARGRPKGVQSFARLAIQVFNEKIAIKENGERRIITKQQAALKQLANKAASGDARAIRDMLRLQAAIAAIEAAEHRVVRAEQREPPTPAETNPSKIALALLSVLHSAREQQLALPAEPLTLEMVSSEPSRGEQSSGALNEQLKSSPPGLP